MTIKEIIPKSIKILTAKNISSANLDAEILLLHCLEKSKNLPPKFNSDRAWLYSHNDYNLAKKQETLFLKLIHRRARHVPIAYITNKKEFYGLEFYVDKNVLIPRPETEILVENALNEIITLRPASTQRGEQAQGDNKKIVISDIGTGSGAIAISIAKSLKDVGKNENINIFATDISAKALGVAKKNAKTHNCNKYIIFKKGNLLQALPKNIKVDYLLANLPYINEKNYHKLLNKKITPIYRMETNYEPQKALLGGTDGLECFNKFFQQLPEYLAENAKIFLESDPHQIITIKKLAKKYLPKNKITVIKDLRGLKRITEIEL